MARGFSISGRSEAPSVLQADTPPPSSACADGGGVSASVGKPPVGNTGVEITAGVHWLAGTVLKDSVDSVLDWLAGWLGESVVVLDRGANGYSEAYLVGPVKVMANELRPDMGVFVEVPGAGCDELGLSALVELGARLRVSRLDLAVDNCPFTPAEIRDAWRSGHVRTRCKVPDNARADRQWRTSKWHESATGDTFTMGGRQSLQFARVYDSRGFTRFELELKRGAAQAAFEQVSAAVQGNSEVVGLVVLSWVRRFVDFVDRDSDSNVSRAALLPFWEAFIAGAEKARVVLEGAITRTVDDAWRWLERQASPYLAVVRERFGEDRLLRMIERGKNRWGSKHRALARSPFGPIAI